MIEILIFILGGILGRIYEWRKNKEIHDLNDQIIREQNECRQILKDYIEEKYESDMIPRIIESQKPTIRDFNTVVLRDNAMQEESTISDIKWIKLESEKGKLTIQCARFKPF